MEHHFDVEIAKEYGVNEAIILNHIFFWIEKNRANETNFYDGYYWTYSSAKAFEKLFPYMCARSILRYLKHLIDEDILIKGNYNKSPYDKTSWYAITDKGYSVLRHTPFDSSKEVEPEEKEPEKSEIKEKASEIIDYLNEKTGSNYRAKAKETVSHIKARLEEGFTVDDFKTVIDKKVKSWGKDDRMCQYLRPSTLFGTKFESYLNEITKSTKEHDNPHQFDEAVDDFTKL